MSIYFETGRSAGTQNSKRIKWFSEFSEGLTRIIPEIKWVLSEQKMWTECCYRRQKNIYCMITDKVLRIQTLGNDTNVAMLNCDWSGFHQSEDKRKLRSSYVTSILITKLTFARFLLKLSTLSADIFLFVSLVLSLLCGRSTGVFHYCFFSALNSLSDVDIRHW